MANPISSSSGTGQGPGATPGLVEEKSAEQAAKINTRGKCKVKEGETFRVQLHSRFGAKEQGLTCTGEEPIAEVPGRHVAPSQ